MPVKTPRIDLDWVIKHDVPVFAKPANSNSTIKGSNGFYDATTDPEVISRWCHEYPGCNWAMRTGNVIGPEHRPEVLDRGLIAFDPDQHGNHNGIAALQKLQEEYGSLPDSLTSITPNGKHIFFRISDTAINTQIGFRPGLDVLGNGGNATIPNSRREGKIYQFVDPEHPIVDLPQNYVELIAWVHQKHSGNRLDFTAIKNGVSSGSRNEQLFLFACTLRSSGMSFDVAEHRILEAAARCSPPLPEKEAKECLKSAWKYPDSFRLSDYGNAQRMTHGFGEDIRHASDQKRWYACHKQFWFLDVGEVAIRQAAKITATRIQQEAMDSTNENMVKQIQKHARNSESAAAQRNMIEMARTEPGIPIHSEAFDANPMVVGALNGVIDLRTGELRDALRSDYITKQVGAEYDPNAKCHTFIRFLIVIFNGNRQIIRYLQRVVGYCLTGKTSEHSVFFFYGTGSNGKSTFISILEFLLGDYAVHAEPETWMVKRNSGASSEIARLRGARLVATTELEEGQRIAEALLKSMSGEDKMTARFLYSEQFEFRPQFKILLATNHRPIIRGDDWSIWRRIKLVPFDVTIPEDRQDKFLSDKLQNELPGILAWAVRGCLSWQRDGLCEPDAVKLATQDYRTDMDVLLRFIDDQCVVVKSARVNFTRLYESYRCWAESSNEFVMTKKMFGTKLSDRGFVKGKDRAGRFYTGIGLAAHDF